MRAELIAIGDELVSGQRLDTNSPWLSERLAELGVTVGFHTTVGDDMLANLTAFRAATQRVDLVIATGGLGPTADDLTRDVLAELVGKPLVWHQPSWEHICQLFAARGRTVPERNRVQAMLPEGAEPIPNRHGTAPGIYLRVPRSGSPPAHVFALPGVPAEMRQLWQEYVAPTVRALMPQPVCIQRHVVKCFGLGESDLEARLPDLIRRGRRPAVGITVSQATISLRIQAEGGSKTECQQQIDHTVALIRQSLGPVVFGEGEHYELQHAVADLLAARQVTLAVAECGTQGIVTHWLAEADKGVFRGGWVLPELTDAPLPDTPATDSLPTRIGQWADAVRRHWQADLGLAIGPWPDSPGLQPTGHLIFALACGNETRMHSVPVVGHPDLLRVRAAKQALDFVRLLLASNGI
ncbi:MAG: damage-inducible protein CinA [Pirellulaceae bacterium]|nr:MAG: damage-inducible protein CinA [Pirellulaceae bacterium]